MTDAETKAELLEYLAKMRAKYARRARNARMGTGRSHWRAYRNRFARWVDLVERMGTPAGSEFSRLCEYVDGQDALNQPP